MPSPRVCQIGSSKSGEGWHIKCVHIRKDKVPALGKPNPAVNPFPIIRTMRIRIRL
jgi:hypothetical protein